MPEPLQIRQDDAQSLIRLLGDVRSGSTTPEQGRTLIDGLCRLVGADVGWFVELVQQGGVWLPAGACAGSVTDSRLEQYMQQWGREFPVVFDVMATSIIADPRPTFVQTWQQARNAAPARQLGPFADLVGTMKIADMADPVFSLNENHRFAMNLQRVGRSRRPFDDRELALLELAAGELKWLHDTCRLKLSALTRDPVPAPLTPRLRQVFDAMLKGESPKQIARGMGISVHTVREHIQRLYRHLQVAGRDELMAKFLKT